MTFFLSCEEKDCTQNLNNPAGIGFYTHVNSSETDTVLSLLSVYGESKRDSFLYDSVANVSSLTVPLDPGKDFSRFIFEYDSISDTLQINYKRELTFISHACGFTTDYTVEGINSSNNRLDSVIVTNQIITRNQNEEHVKIYFSPADPVDRQD